MNPSRQIHLTASAIGRLSPWSAICVFLIFCLVHCPGTLLGTHVCLYLPDGSKRAHQGSLSHRRHQGFKTQQQQTAVKEKVNVGKPQETSTTSSQNVAAPGRSEPSNNPVARHQTDTRQITIASQHAAGVASHPSNRSEPLCETQVAAPQSVKSSSLGGQLKNHAGRVSM